MRGFWDRSLWLIAYSLWLMAGAIVHDYDYVYVDVNVNVDEREAP